MKRKNLITSALALTLVTALGMGATLAFLTDNDAAKNTFTTGNVKIDLVEPSWDPENGQDLAAGDVIEKDPAIVNIGKNDAYMMLKVTGVDAMRAKDFEVYFDDENWALVDENGNTLELDMVAAEDSETGEEEAQLVDGYYVYLDTVEAGEATEPLFTKVYYTDKAEGATFGDYLVKGILNEEQNGVDHYEIWNAEGEAAVLENAENNFASYDLAADYIVENLISETEYYYTYDMDIFAYGIQAENVEFVNGSVYGWVATVLE